MLAKNRPEIILDNRRLDDARYNYLVAFRDDFLPSVVVHLSMWTPTALIGSIDSSGSASGSPSCSWMILAPKQYHMRIPFTTGRGSYSSVACPKASSLVVA